MRLADIGTQLMPLMHARKRIRSGYHNEPGFIRHEQRLHFGMEPHARWEVMRSWKRQ